MSIRLSSQEATDHFRQASTQEGRDGLLTYAQRRVRIAIGNQNIEEATVWSRVVDTMKDYARNNPWNVSAETNSHDDSVTNKQNLPYQMLRLALKHRMPDVLLHTFSNGPGSEGLYLKFPDMMDKYLIVSDEAGADMFRNWRTLGLTKLSNLRVPRIVLWHYDEPDGQDGDRILDTEEQGHYSFAKAVDLIVDYTATWVNGERNRRKLTHARKQAQAAKKIEDNDKKYFPFLPKGFGGCTHTGLINTASSEAAIEIMKDLLKLDPEKGPSTKLTEAFDGDEEVGDQLQSLLMAAYQQALVDLLKGGINLRDVVAAGLDGGVIKPDSD